MKKLFDKQTLLFAGKLMLRLAPITVLLFACSPVPRSSPFQVTIPTLQSPPLEIPCQAPEPTTCTVVLKSDWEAVIRELKTACLALGGTEERCHTNGNGSR